MLDRQIKAVLFDWDFTLAHVMGEATSAERLGALFQQEGLVYTLEEIQAALLRYDDERKPDAPVTPQTRQNIITFYRQVLTHLGHNEMTWEQGNRLYSAYSYLPLTLYEDTLPTLQALQERGFVLGIISNHATAVRALMEEQVGAFIPAQRILISQEVGVHKPAKTIFRQASTQLRVAPDNCLYVGDNLLVDAIGAVEQGEFAAGLWLDRKGVGTDEILPERVYRITTLYQVLEFV